MQSPVFIILDALDEANMENVNDFLSILRTLNSSWCKLFLTSRGLLDHADLFSPDIQVEIQHPSNSDDIRQYVNSILNNLRDSNSLRGPDGLAIRATDGDDNLRIQSQLEDLSEAIARHSRGLFPLAYLYALSTSAAPSDRPLNNWSSKVGFSINPKLQISPMSRMKWEMRLKSNPFGLREATRQILLGIDLQRPEGFLRSLILVWLSIAPAPLSVPALETALPNLSSRFFISRTASISPDYVPKAFVYLNGLVNIDHGNNLVHLSSEMVREEVKKIWSKEWVQSFPELMPYYLKRQIALYCLQHQLDLNIQAADLELESSVESRLGQNPFLAHAVMAWTAYCRDSWQLISSSPSFSPTPDTVSQPSQSYPETTRMQQPEGDPTSTSTANSHEKTGYEAVSNPAAANSAEEVLQPTVVNTDHQEMLCLIGNFASSRDKLSALVLLPMYLGKDPTARTLSWQESFSWVSSMSTLHILSKLGIVSLVCNWLDFKLSEVNDIDERGFTPLHEAVQGGFEDDVRILLQGGASPLTRDSALKTPMDHAIEESRNGIFAVLFEKFCEEYYNDADLKNVLGLAKYYASCIREQREEGSPTVARQGFFLRGC
ncbi:hypothetical protein F5Y10DRAFT_256340 [Nemania abortiva]|nr:hypothetical protein F5Y10DRAFT_256340 [Nemania abortiva]